MSIPRTEQVDVIADIDKRLRYCLNSILDAKQSDEGSDEGPPDRRLAAQVGASLARTLAMACEELADSLERD